LSTTAQFPGPGTPGHAESYGSKEYWDQRYNGEDVKYEWYLGYPGFKGSLIPYLGVAGATDKAASSGLRLRSSVKTLIVGCGNSDLSDDMFRDGFTDLWSVDYSSTVIDKMKLRMPHLKFETMDCRAMSYESDSFDCVVDKGTLDAVLCGVDSAKNADALLAECYRVLRPGGIFAIVTYGDPNCRVPHLSKPRYKWRISTHTVGKTRFIYVMEKWRQRTHVEKDVTAVDGSIG